MLIEVIGVSLDDVIQAIAGEADRIELCQSIVEEGLTPSYGLIKSALHISTIPIHVMVRPHNKSFIYSEHDVKQMVEDINMIRQLGAHGVVFGALTTEGEIDEVVLEKLLEAAGSLDVTFHRAFDLVEDQQQALDTLLQYGKITTLLTSGGGRSALDYTNTLANLIERTKDTHLTIMPGGGLRVEDAGAFQEKTQANALHFGSGVRIDSDYEEAVSASQIKRVRTEIAGIV